MEFWAIEVKSGATVIVEPGHDMVLHLSQANLGEIKKGKGNESVHLFVNIVDEKKKLVLGTLFSGRLPQQQFDLVFDKDFELSHNWKGGSVYFFGYKAANYIGEEETDGSEPLVDRFAKMTKTGDRKKETGARIAQKSRDVTDTRRAPAAPVAGSTQDKAAGKRLVDAAQTEGLKRQKSTEGSGFRPTGIMPVWEKVFDLPPIPIGTEPQVFEPHLHMPIWRLGKNDSVIDPASARTWNREVCLPRDLQMFAALSDSEAERQYHHLSALTHACSVDRTRRKRKWSTSARLLKEELEALKSSSKAALSKSQTETERVKDELQKSDTALAEKVKELERVEKDIEQCLSAAKKAGVREYLASQNFNKDLEVLNAPAYFAGCNANLKAVHQAYSNVPLAADADQGIIYDPDRPALYDSYLAELRETGTLEDLWAPDDEDTAPSSNIDETATPTPAESPNCFHDGADPGLTKIDLN